MCKIILSNLCLLVSLTCVFGQALNKVYSIDANSIEGITNVKTFDNKIILIGTRIGMGKADVFLQQVNLEGIIEYEEVLSNDSLFYFASSKILDNIQIVNTDTFFYSIAKAYTIDTTSYSTYFLKYNWTNKSIEHFKLLDISDFYDASEALDLFNFTLHKDGYIYASGRKVTENNNGVPTADLAFSKIDTAGNLIWQRVINMDEIGFQSFWDYSFEISSISLSRLCMQGRYNSQRYGITNFPANYQMLIDTSGNIVKRNDFEYKFIVARRNAYFDTLRNSFYHIARTDSFVPVDRNDTSGVIDNYRLHLFTETDTNLKVVWDTLIPHHMLFDLINIHEVKSFGDDLYFVGEIDPVSTLNSNKWSLVVKWNLNTKEQEWERIYYHDSTTNFINELHNMDKLSNGNLVFGGHTYGGSDSTAWLLVTDSIGCGILPNCYDTFEEYYNFEYPYNPPTSLYYEPIHLKNQVKIIQNPVQKILRLEVEEALLTKHPDIQLNIYTTSGKQVFAKKLNENHFQKNIQEWESGVYVLSVYSSGNLFWSGKVVKN